MSCCLFLGDFLLNYGALVCVDFCFGVGCVLYFFNVFCFIGFFVWFGFLEVISAFAF